MLSGKCECAAVRYEVADAFEYALNCHCSNCRAATGSAFKAVAGIRREQLELTAGADALLVVGGEYVHVALGSLVDAPSIRPTKHIWVSQKAPWFEITDGLPQFEEFPT